MPAPPGANLDTIPRIIADKLSTRWGQPVIIEHRPGAAQNLGAEVVARSEPDGYTLLATPQGPLVISQHFFAKLGFDPNAFAPVSIIASQPLVLVAHPKFRASSLKELVASAKGNEDQLCLGRDRQLAAPDRRDAQARGQDRFRPRPLQGSGAGDDRPARRPCRHDVRQSHQRAAAGRDGKVKALAVAGAARIPELPDVPAIAEMFPGFYSTSWFAIVAPPKTPPDIAAKISQAIAAALKLPDVVERYRALASTPVGSRLPKRRRS